MIDQIMIFMLVSAAISVLFGAVKKMFPTAIGKIKRFHPMIPLLMGGAAGPFVVPYFLKDPSVDILVSVLIGVMAGAMSTSNYQLLKDVLLRKAGAEDVGESPGDSTDRLDDSDGGGLLR